MHMAELSSQHREVLKQWRSKLAAYPDPADGSNIVPAHLSIRLAGRSHFEFLPAASLAIQSLVPADSAIYAALDQAVAELRTTFPGVAAITYWQPSGTYHLNVAILQRLTTNTELLRDHQRLVTDAHRVLDWLDDQPAYAVRFDGMLVTSTGSILVVGEPLSDTPCRIREQFQRHSFPDQQVIFHVTLGRILRAMASADWRQFLTLFYTRFDNRMTGTLQVNSALLVSESKGFLHSPSHYNVLRTFRFGRA